MKGLYKIGFIILSLFFIPFIESQTPNFPTTHLNELTSIVSFNKNFHPFFDNQPDFTGGAIDNEKNALIVTTKNTLTRINPKVPIVAGNFLQLGSYVQYNTPLENAYSGSVYKGDSKHLIVRYTSNVEYNFLKSTAVIVREGIIIIIGTPESTPNNIYISRHNSTTLQRLDTTPPQLNQLKGTFKVLEDDSNFYYIIRDGANSRIVKIEKDDILVSNSISSVPSEMQIYIGYSFKDAFLQESRIYFTSDNKIGYINTADLAISVEDEPGTTYGAIIYDSDAERGNYVFAATEGSSSNPTTVTYFDPDTLAKIDDKNFLTNQYGFTTSVYESGGIWYFATKGHLIGSRHAGILQYDTAKNKPEGLSDIGRNIESHTILYDKNNRKLFTLGKEAFGDPMLSIYNASELCLGDCYGNGDCNRRKCNCYADKDGDFEFVWHEETWCFTRDCSNLTENGEECNGEEHGTCLKDNKGTCLCTDDWKGDACEIRRCPKDCLGHGKCNESNYTCSCHPGWDGRACELSIKLPCYLLNDCKSCVDNSNCVWCASSSLCYNGTNVGPDDDNVECRYWYYSQCPSVAFDVVNYLFTAIIALVIILNVVSIAIFDSSDESSNTRERWYLLQRANKGWTMIRQLQLLCIAGLLAYNLPTNFLAFPRYWNWITLSFGYAWNTVEPGVDNPVKSTRDLSSVEQFQTYWKTDNGEIFFAFLIWFGVLIGIGLLLMLISVILAVIRKTSVGYILKTRFIYMLIRILEFGHLGICVLGPIALLKGGKSAVAGGIIWVVVGILIPVALYIKIAFFTPKKDLFRPPTVDRFSSFYGLFNLKNDMAIKLTILPYAYRIIVGLFFGFFATSSVPGQLVPLLIIHIGQIVLFIVFKDLFSDYLQRYLEIFLAFINMISFALLFAYSKHPSQTTSGAIGITFLVFQFLGVTACGAFLIISWLQKQEIYTLKQCWNCFLCRKE